MTVLQKSANPKNSLPVVTQQKIIEEINCETVPENTVVLYSGPAFFKILQKFNTIRNPLKITHCGFVIHISGKELHDLADSGKFPNVSSETLSEVKKGIFYDDEIIRPFSIEAHWPHVLITPLDVTVQNYPGSVRMRKLNNKPAQITWTDVIGVHYEVKWWKMFFAEWRLNCTEDSSSLFCSELAALLVKRAGFLTVNSSNVLPEMMGTPAKKYDVLKDVYFGEEILKVVEKQKKEKVKKEKVSKK
ncbi:Papain-like_cysteine peptidase superfamily [Hexamita inflata]|uniref:Papain-like_cysteine peptidase superfamily n=1 Tax=Hexamita inflata TaxID=28002 RepID=A0ABP1KJL2_9EUKA